MVTGGLNGGEVARGLVERDCQFIGSDGFFFSLCSHSVTLMSGSFSINGHRTGIVSTRWSRDQHKACRQDRHFLSRLLSGLAPQWHSRLMIAIAGFVYLAIVLLTMTQRLRKKKSLFSPDSGGRRLLYIPLFSVTWDKQKNTPTDRIRQPRVSLSLR